MAPRILNGSTELKAAIGEHLGYSDWMEITQERVNQFAEATGDHQWPHATHTLLRNFWQVHRNPLLLFPSRQGGVKGAATATTPMDAGGVQTTYQLTFETEGATKPSCVAEVIFRAYQ